MVDINIKRSVLEWAVGRAGFDFDELIEKARGKERKEKIANGIIPISLAKRLAVAARIPFGFLMLPTPPEIKRPEIPDLRTFKYGRRELSDRFYEQFEDVRTKVEWFSSEVTDGPEDTPDYVGRFTESYLRGEVNARDIAKDIAKTLNYRPFENREIRTPEDNFRYLSSLCEDKGMLVFKSSFVAGKTQQKLSVDEFRGFVITEYVLPAIFVNGADYPQSWVFTLAHELAHVWLNKPGVVGANTENLNEESLESFCNKVAAFLVMPEEKFLFFWKTFDSQQVMNVARVMKVSLSAAAIRARELHLIDDVELRALLDRIKLVVNRSNSAPTIYQVLPVRCSKRLTRYVVRRAVTGDLLLNDAAKLLNVKPKTVVSLHEHWKN